MWMMGYNDGGGSDPFTGRKLRTIVPRPAAVINHPTCTLGRIHGADLLSFNHQLAAMSEQNKRDFSPQQVVVSSRWNPTPEQLQTLEELYRRGTRTPSAEEIQHITAQLRRYGKIEGKNVFYWFQNHKARERQKRRRQLESSGTNSDVEPPSAAAAYNNNNNNNNMNGVEIENTESKEEESETGANGTGLEVEGTKNWPPSTNCSSTLAEKPGSLLLQRRSAAKAAAIQECRVADHGWVHFDEMAEFHQQRKSLEEETNATWHMMTPFSCCSSSPLSSPTNLINSSSSTAAINSSSSSAITTVNPALTVPPPPPPSRSSVLIKNNNNNSGSTIFINPYRNEFHYPSSNAIHNLHETNHSAADQTLQLFPLRNTNGGRGLGDGDVAEKELSEAGSVHEDMNISSNTIKFFEFLPLKN